VGAQTSSGSTDSAGQLRAQLTQLKRQLDAVKKDDKIDCKTKDSETQSIERSMTQIQQQLDARVQQQQKAAVSPVSSSSQTATDTAAPSATPAKNGNALVDCYV
jgi:hypothetical protein